MWNIFCVTHRQTGCLTLHDLQSARLKIEIHKLAQKFSVALKMTDML